MSNILHLFFIETMFIIVIIVHKLFIVKVQSRCIAKDNKIDILLIFPNEIEK